MVSKKILKVKALKGKYASNYAHTGLMFAYCSNITNNEVKQMTNFCSCREDLANCLFHDKYNRIPITRSRYIVRHVMANINTKPSEKWFNKATEAGLKIVNVMEDQYGWPLTKLLDAESNVNNAPADHYNPARQLTTLRKVMLGSSKWVRSPHMISLYILLFRLGINKKFNSIKNYNDLSYACSSCTAHQFGDVGHVFRTFKFWDMIMTNFDKMFAGTPVRDNFKSSRYSNGHYNEGISKLCGFRCANEAISSKFVALAKNANLA